MECTYKNIEQNAVADNEVTPGIYEHYRGGRYEVIGVARYSEDPHQEFVLYKMLYESKLEPEGTVLPAGTLWVRSKKMFAETFTDAHGAQIKRFKKIS